MDLSSLTPSLVSDLPADELAVRVLVAITAEENPAGFFFGKDRVIHPDMPASNRQLAQRLEEAFAWLEREVWIAHEPSQHSDNWYFVTRRGWAVLKDPEGLARARAEARLQVDL